jgi:GNAT superfamily N-acetyltransferase
LTWSIRRIGDGLPDLDALVKLIDDVSPDNSTSVEEIRWADATYPGTGRWLAEPEGRVLGAATIGRIWMRDPDYDGLWASIDVRPDSRRRGIGSALYEAISTHARTAGKHALHIETRGDQPAAIAFLANRGFIELERAKAVALDLRGREPPIVAPPDGVSIVTLAERPDLVEGIFHVAEESFADIPSVDEPMRVGTLAEFRARDIDRPGIPAEGFAIAIDDTTGQVIGYASLIFQPGSSTRAYHDMTAVVRTWRGRGVARTLKWSTIAWAIGAGLEWLETGNDVANAPMRALNAQLGYTPLPDLIEFRGPLVSTVPAPAAR